MNSLLAAEGRKLNSGAGGLGGGISSRVFSSCLRRASLAAAWRLAGDSFTPIKDKLLPEEEPFKLDAEAYETSKGMQKQDRCKDPVMIRIFLTCLSNAEVTKCDVCDHTVGPLFKASLDHLKCENI